MGDMTDGTLRTIGELARLTGIPVKTIRFWSDAGVVPPASRTPAGYRLYGQDALARLGLVRTLRDLGIGLAVIQRVLAREVSVAEVADAHADALDLQIRTLRLHRAVLRTVARRDCPPEEMELMHKAATLTAVQRRRLISDFIDSVFGGLDVSPEFLAMMRGAMPDLPDEPTAEQLGAWVELAELTGDERFRAGLRRAAADQTQAIAEGGEPDAAAARRVADLVRERAGAAQRAGIDPASAQARPVVDELAQAYAELSGRADSPEFRAWLADRLEVSADSGYERYWQLLAVINGWPPQPSMAPAVGWLLAALRAG